MVLKKFLSFAAVAAMLLVCSVDAKAEVNAWGGLFFNGAGSPQALSTTAAKVTAFATALPSSTTDGDLSIVSSVADDNVAVIANGVYLVRFTYTGTADATTAITFSLRDGATAITGAASTINHPASTAVSTTIDFIYRPTAAGTLNVYAASASGTPSITATSVQLAVVRLR